MRFWNNEIMSNLEGVLATVMAEVAELPLPQPLSRKGRGVNASAPSNTFVCTPFGRVFSALDADEFGAAFRRWIRHAVPALDCDEVVGIDGKTSRRSGRVNGTPLHLVSAFAARLNRAVRLHWRVENSLHWCMDVAFGDDQMRARTGNAAHNFAVVRHFALNLIRLAPVKRKGGIKVRRLIASTSDAYRAELLGLV